MKGEERAWCLEEDIRWREDFYCRCEPCLHMREEPVGYQVGGGGSSRPQGKKYFITDVDRSGSAVGRGRMVQDSKARTSGCRLPWCVISVPLGFPIQVEFFFSFDKSG